MRIIEVVLTHELSYTPPKTMHASKLVTMSTMGSCARRSSKVTRINDIYLIPQLSKSCLIKGLGEDVGELILGPDIREMDITLLHMLSNEVMTNLDVIRLGVENGVVGDLDSTLIVTKKRHLVEVESIILHCLPHPKQLSTTTCRGDVLGFGGGEG